MNHKDYHYLYREKLEKWGNLLELKIWDALKHAEIGVGDKGVTDMLFLGILLITADGFKCSYKLEEKIRMHSEAVDTFMVKVFWSKKLYNMFNKEVSIPLYLGKYIFKDISYYIMSPPLGDEGYIYPDAVGRVCSECQFHPRYQGTRVMNPAVTTHIKCGRCGFRIEV